MNIKNQHNGFSFIEALVALMVMSTMMTILFTLYTKVMRTTRKATTTFERIVGLKNFIADVEQKVIQAGKKGVEKFEKKDEDRDVTYSYKQEPLPEKSSLKKVPHLIIEKYTSAWHARDTSYQDVIVMVRFKPEKQEQHEQKK